MDRNIAVTNQITFEQVFDLAQQLRPLEQARLVAKLAPKVEWFLEKVESASVLQQPTTLRGALADLGTAPSASEIDEVQQEMWSTFAGVSNDN